MNLERQRARSPLLPFDLPLRLGPRYSDSDGSLVVVIYDGEDDHGAAVDDENDGEDDLDLGEVAATRS